MIALLCFAHFFVLAQKSSFCIAFWDNVHPFTMPGSPGQLMTREKIISRERHQKSPTYERVNKLFLESEFQHKGNKQTKTTRILSKIARFSRQQLIQKIKIFKNYTDTDKKWIELSSLGQEYTLTVVLTFLPMFRFFPSKISYLLHIIDRNAPSEINNCRTNYRYSPQ